MAWLNNSPQGELVITGHTSDTIYRNILLPLMNFLGGPPLCDFSIGRRIGWLFGRTTHIISGNDESSYKRLQGPTLVAAYCDEVTTYPKSFWLMLLSRLSVKGARLFGTTNPDVPTHWLKTDFIDSPEVKNKQVFQFTLYDNPFLDKDYIESLKREYSGVWQKRYIEGLWVAGSGTIYDCFSDENIVTDMKQHIPRFQRLWAACDYGTVNPLAFCVFGLDDDGKTIYQLAEYYYDSKQHSVQKSDEEYVFAIKDFLEKLDIPVASLEGFYVDPSAASFIIALRHAGIPVSPAQNEVMEGIQYVYTLISKKQFLVDSSCTMSIKHLYSYSWDTRAYTRGKEQPLKIDDHLPDCIRYALFSAKLRKTEYSGIEGIVTRPRTGISTILKNKRGTL
jgi:PBSX family phage terminase large subunit